MANGKKAMQLACLKRDKVATALGSSWRLAVRIHNILIHASLLILLSS